jgi:hypothetical protein
MTEQKKIISIEQTKCWIVIPTEFGELQNFFSSGAVCLVLASDVSKKVIWILISL